MAEYSHDSSADFEVGFKEDYSEIITDISPQTTPIISMLGNETVDSTHYETYSEDLYSRDGSTGKARKESVGVSDVTAKNEDLILMENRTMVYFDYVQASATARKSKQVGINDVLDHKGGRLLIHLKQCYESRVLTGVKMKTHVAGTTGGYFRGMPGEIGRYADVCNGGTDYGTDSDNVVTSIQNFASTSPDAQDTLNDVLQERWDDGGEPAYLLCSSTAKVDIAAFDASGVTRMFDNPRKIVENVEIYESPLGEVAVVPSHALQVYDAHVDSAYDAAAASGGTQVTDFAFLIDPKVWKTITLQGDGWRSENVSPTGRNYERFYTAQVGLRCYNSGGEAVFDFAGNSSFSNTEGLPTTVAGYVG